MVDLLVKNKESYCWQNKVCQRKKAIIKIGSESRVLCEGIKDMGITDWLKNAFVKISNVPLPEHFFTLTVNMTSKSLSLS